MVKIKHTIRSIVSEASCHPVTRVNQVTWVTQVIQVIWVIWVTWVIMLCYHVIFSSCHKFFNICYWPTDWLTNGHTTLGSTGLLRRQKYLPTKQINLYLLWLQLHIHICPESFCEILFHCTFFSSFLNILTKLFLSTEFKSIYFALSTAENISEYRKIE